MDESGGQAKLSAPRGTSSEDLFLIVATVLMITAVDAQAQRGGRGQGRGGAIARGGRGAAPPAVPPAPAIPNVSPVRSCESLAMVALPDTTIELAAVDPNDSAVCRVEAGSTDDAANFVCGTGF